MCKDIFEYENKVKTHDNENNKFLTELTNYEKSNQTNQR